MKFEPKDIERFLSKVNKTETCWLWTGAPTPKGYGRFSIGYVEFRAHRFSYEAFVGPIPGGMVIDHVVERGCTSRLCVRPDHLEPVTIAENIRRGQTGIHERSRTHCPRGHPYDEANTGRYGGKRYCRACARNRMREGRVT